MKAILVTTQEESDRILEIYEKKWWKRASGAKPTAIRELWKQYKQYKQTGYEAKDVFYACDIQYFKTNKYTVLSFEEWLRFLWEEVRKNTNKRPTYNKIYVRNDGKKFEKDSIDGVSIKDIQDGIENRNKEIKIFESLLRAHRALKF